MSMNKQPDESSIRNRQNVHEADPALEKSNTELLNEIDTMLADPDAEFNLDTDKLKHYLEILQERAPVAEDYVPGEIHSELKKKLPLRDVGKSARSQEPAEGWFSRKRKTFGRAVLSIAGATLALVMTAAAFGYNPIQAFLDWADGVVQVWGNPSGVMELPGAEPGEYKSLEEALEVNGVSSSGLPRWVPQDYALAGVNVQDAGVMKKYSALYEGVRGELMIRVMEIDANDWMTDEERNEDGYPYLHKGVEYYLVSNSGQGKAGWQIGTYSFLINGQISEDELKTMIDSIS